MVKRALVVDDEAHVTRLIRLRLEKEGYAVETAADGFEALTALEQEEFGVVITDFNMPRMNGRELCLAIRERFPGSPMTLYLVTARVDQELRAWADGLPRVEYIEKPLSMRALVAKLAALEGGSEPTEESPA